MDTRTYSVLDTTAIRAQAVTLTDNLIYRVVKRWADTGQMPALLFLDKSGRPVGWLLRALWPVLARTPGTVYSDAMVPPMPSCHFANIDREQWWDITGGSETGDIDVYRIPAETIAGLRAVFLRRRPASGTSTDVMSGASFLDDTHVIVIDEVSVSGDTLRIARAMVERVFDRGTTVDATHWMTPAISVDRRSGQRVPRGMPVWYSEHEWGRLVGNRLSPNHRGAHWRGVFGKYFLSTVPTDPDQVGRTLRREATMIADDVRTGRLLARPCIERTVQDQAERIRTLYGYDDLRAFTRARVAAEQG